MDIAGKIKGIILKKKINKKKAIIAGAVVVAGCAGIYLYASGGNGGVTGRPAGMADRGGTEEMRNMAGIKQPETDADVIGLISEIQGNKITILKLDAADVVGMGGGRPAGSASGAGAGTGGRPAGEKSGSGERQRPQGMPSGVMPSGGQAADGAESSRIKELKKKSLGEEVVTVPVGIQMLSAGMTESAFTDLKEDSLVMIWLNPDITDGKVARFVNIMG